MLVQLTTRGDRKARVSVNTLVVDRHRLAQLSGGYHPAGLVCCYLGVANPFGMGSSAESILVKLDIVEENTDD